MYHNNKVMKNKDIKIYPITASTLITVFRGSPNLKYKLSNGHVCIGNHYDNDFLNLRLNFDEHILIGNLESDKIENRLTKFFKEIKFNQTKNTAKETLIDYLNSQNYNTETNVNDTIWVIIPKVYKEPKGDYFLNIFTNLNTPNFNYGEYQDLELKVYMTPITPKIKNITFRVDIPDYIYNKCMEDVNIENRPKLRYIESVSLSTLHVTLSEYNNQAFNIENRKRESEKCFKKLVIIFNANESSQRDTFNHAYMGQKLSTNFQYFEVYEFRESNGQLSYFSYNKLGTMGSIGKNLTISNHQNDGQKSYFHSKPNGIIIDWSQEREDFLKTLEEQFRQLKTNLNTFLSNLDNEKIDMLITNSTLSKLLN